jgi:hypothetical protein
VTSTSKHVYVVVSIKPNTEKLVTHLPVLGVHSSFKSASRHYSSVVSDRLGGTQKFPASPRAAGIAHLKHVRNALIYQYYYNDEIIRLERWTI